MSSNEEPVAGKPHGGFCEGHGRFLTWFKLCDTPQTERAEKQGIQSKPKGGTTTCLLDN